MSSAATPFPEMVRKTVGWSIALSVLLILAGFFALFIPFISGIGITLFIGWLMIISGITHFVFAFKTHTTGGVLWELLLGAVYLFTGVYLIMHPLARHHQLAREIKSCLEFGITDEGRRVWYCNVGFVHRGADDRRTLSGLDR